MEQPRRTHVSAACNASGELSACGDEPLIKMETADELSINQMTRRFVRRSGQALSANLAQLKTDDWSVFAVQGGKLPAQVPRNEGEPGNWTDTTKAMKFGTVLGGGGGGGAAEPKFSPFSGSAQVAERGRGHT